MKSEEYEEVDHPLETWAPMFVLQVLVVFWFTIMKNSGFPGDWVVKNPPAKQETQTGSLCWEDSLEEEMATHSSILSWKNPMDRGAWSATVHGAAWVLMMKN